MPEHHFEGVLNFRDLGGYAATSGRRVRPHRLYRSMTPEWMSPADVARARDDLGIRLVIDLRGEDYASGPLGERPGRRVAIDVMAPARAAVTGRPATDEHEVMFPWLLKMIAGELIQATEAIAAEPAATLFHCHTGKDRTGLLAALVLGLLGVSDDDIMTDYMLSAPQYEPMLDYLQSVGYTVPDTAPRIAREAPSERGMRAALEMVHRDFGGFEGLLTSAGASDSLVERLSRSLLEPS
jgi:protein-tyrosine phosphatase